MSRTRRKEPSFEELRQEAEAMPSPRSHAEYKAVSGALRRARRAWRGNAFSMPEMSVRDGGFHRRILLQAHYAQGRVTVYQRSPRVLGYLSLITHAASMYRQGEREGRVADARVFCGACREAGPVRLP